MNNLFYIVLLVLVSCQNQSVNPQNQENPRIIHSSVIFKNNIAPEYFDNLIDSGQIKNGLKEGIWVEFTADSSFMDQNISLSIQGLPLEMDYNLKETVFKHEGKYLKGERDGYWVTYKLIRIEPNEVWEIYSKAQYIEGKKHGEEVVFQRSEKEQKPYLVTNWKEGVKHGQMKFFNYKPPYNLLKVYDVKGDVAQIIEEYYSNGRLKVKIQDTVRNNQQMLFMWQYAETGVLVSSGFLSKDGDWEEFTTYYDNGQVKEVEYSLGSNKVKNQYYYQNGRLWTEREFMNGKFWNVYVLQDEFGAPLEVGTFKNGNGTFNVYDEKGKLIEVLKYKDGIEVENM